MFEIMHNNKNAFERFFTYDLGLPHLLLRLNDLLSPAVELENNMMEAC